MKKFFSFFFISIFFLSCQKQQQVSIVGTWREISMYSRDQSGQFYWSRPPSFPYFLTLTEDSKYYGFSCVPAGHGVYQYNYSTRQLRFENSSGNMHIDTVSVLDDNYLIMDYTFNGITEYRQKFIRTNN